MRSHEHEARAADLSPRRPLHLWVVFMITYWKDLLISSDELGPNHIHRVFERTLMTRRGDETVVDWQDDDAVATEATHDPLDHIRIPTLQSDTGIRMKHTADIGMPALDRLDQRSGLFVRTFSANFFGNRSARCIVATGIYQNIKSALHEVARPAVNRVCIAIETCSNFRIKHIGMQLGVIVLDGGLAINEHIRSNFLGICCHQPP